MAVGNDVFVLSDTNVLYMLKNNRGGLRLVANVMSDESREVFGLDSSRPIDDVGCDVARGLLYVLQGSKLSWMNLLNGSVSFENINNIFATYLW